MADDNEKLQVDVNYLPLGKYFVVHFTGDPLLVHFLIRNGENAKNEKGERFVTRGSTLLRGQGSSSDSVSFNVDSADDVATFLRAVKDMNAAIEHGKHTPITFEHPVQTYIDQQQRQA